MILDWNSERRFRRSHVEDGARRTTGQSGGASLLPVGGQSPDRVWGISRIEFSQLFYYVNKLFCLSCAGLKASPKVYNMSGVNNCNGNFDD